MRDRRPAAAAAAFALVLLATAPRPAPAADDRGFGLSVIVDGCEAPEYAHAGKIYVEALRGRNFTLRISNPTAGRIAVALSVDGRNVVDARRTPALEATKWILMPGQSIEVPGWQVSGETARKFYFTETARSYAKWLGDTANVGTIEAVFFREKVRRPMPLERGVVGSVEGGAPGGLPGGVPGGTGPGAPTVEERSADGGTASAEPPATRQRRAEADRFAATGIGDRTDFAVQWIDFDEETRPAARVAVRYEFRRELVRLGVIPRRDDALAAREGATGFEPRYAPDPWGRR